MSVPLLRRNAKLNGTMELIEQCLDRIALEATDAIDKAVRMRGDGLLHGTNLLRRHATELVDHVQMSREHIRGIDANRRVCPPTSFVHWPQAVELQVRVKGDRNAAT